MTLLLNADTADQLHSAERIRDYLLIDHEPSPTKEGEPPAYWPASGHLRAENLSACYSQGKSSWILSHDVYVILIAII